MDIARKLPQKSRELITIKLRNLWFRMNAFIFKSKFDNPRQVVQSALKQLETYQSAQNYDIEALAGQRDKPSIASKKWERPQMLKLKANWNVTINSTTNIMGFGV